MKKFLFVGVGAALFMTSAHADPLFRYQVMGPDHEIRTFFVPAEETILTLKAMDKTKWTCALAKAERIEAPLSAVKTMITPYNLMCRYGNGPAGIGDTAFCDETRHSTRVVRLLDGKTKEYVITLECGIPGT